MTIHLNTLGVPTELIGHDGAPYKFTNAKHLALLTYLALEPGTYSREYLARLIWSTGEPGSLNNALSTLREALKSAEVFPARSKEIVFDASLVETDVSELISLRNSPHPSLERILELYRGPFLEGIKLTGASQKFVSWVARKETEFEQAFLEQCTTELKQAAEKRDWQMIQTLAAAILRRVSGWADSEHWFAVADELQMLALRAQLPAESLAGEHGGKCPEIQQPEEPEQAPTEVRRNRVQSPLLTGIVLAVVLLGVAVVARMEFLKSSDSTERMVVNTSPAAPVCAPDSATGQLVDEVFHFGIHARPRLPFAKAWTLQNSGRCSWNRDFRLHYKASSSVRLSTTMMDVPLTRIIGPGDTVTFRLPMLAPANPGTYDEHWELRDAADRPVLVGGRPILAARIVVPQPDPPACDPGHSVGSQLVKKFMDGVVRLPGERFRFGWTLKNTGACSWPAGAIFRRVTSSNGSVSQETTIRATRSVAPGQNYTFLVSVQAPRQAGVYREDWTLEDLSGASIPIDGHPTVNMQFRIPNAEEPVASLPICRPGEANVRFVDENWLDETVMQPGQRFVKRWTVFNVGSCAWAPDFRLKYASSTKGMLSLSQADRPLGETVPPWTTYTFEIPMQMPIEPGPYREDWRFVDAAGNLIPVSMAPYVAAILSVGNQ